MTNTESKPLVGVSLKMYFGLTRTREWLQQVCHLVQADPGLTAAADAFVLPSFPVLESTAAILAGTGMAFGAQDLAAADDGAQTGEVSGEMLAAIGCRYVAVGHAERRAAFGETDAVVAAKFARAVTHGLIPVLCVGEVEHTDPLSAARACVEQLRPALDHEAADVVIAYEPVWAIGAAAPAAAEHVAGVALRLRKYLANRSGRSRLLYGGSAGKGAIGQLLPFVDGLFLGRAAHDPRRFVDLLRQFSDNLARPVVSNGERPTRSLRTEL